MSGSHSTVGPLHPSRLGGNMEFIPVTHARAGLVYDFVNNLNSFYGVISEFCTPELCPTMAAGPR